MCGYACVCMYRCVLMQMWMYVWKLGVCAACGSVGTVWVFIRSRGGGVGGVVGRRREGRVNGDAMYRYIW